MSTSKEMIHCLETTQQSIQQGLLELHHQSETMNNIQQTSSQVQSQLTRSHRILDTMLSIPKNILSKLFNQHDTSCPINQSIGASPTIGAPPTKGAPPTIGAPPTPVESSLHMEIHDTLQHTLKNIKEMSYHFREELDRQNKQLNNLHTSHQTHIDNLHALDKKIDSLL
tara:strand:- start:143 stop:649 length:507 start_codon:yes stop_codon:yes gene_type:complete